jgi:hypothetical protein
MGGKGLYQEPLLSHMKQKGVTGKTLPHTLRMERMHIPFQWRTLVSTTQINMQDTLEA